MFFNNLALLGALAGTSMAGTLLWDGRFSDYASSSDLDNWSWSNQVGEYQWYIHGSGNTTEYVDFASDYANPADTSSTKGAKMTIDSTSSWEGQTMLRTELIPQTTAAIGSGKKFYHFSIKHAETNAPNSAYEHQVAFFESHFTEMKLGSADSTLQWFADSTSQWSVNFTAGTWHNIAYGIDFDAGTVEFYHSTDAEDLTLTAGPVDVSASSNGADWHVGVLRLAATSGTSDDTAAEDWYFSGVYIEEGDITTSVVGATNGTSSSTGSTSSSASVAVSSTAAVVSSSAVSSTQAAVVSSSAAASTQAAVVSTSSAAVSSAAVSSAVVSSSAAVSSAAVSTSAVATSASAASTSSAPTTLQTLVRSSSSAAVSSAVSSAVATSTPVAYTSAPASSVAFSASSSAAEVSPAQTDDAQCVVEYVYV